MMVVRSMTVALAALFVVGCSNEKPDHSCSASSYELGASCHCDKKDSTCVADDSGELRSFACVDGHLRAGEAAACELAPDAAFEKYVRGHACLAHLKDADGMQ